jgi:hypothetical protein
MVNLSVPPKESSSMRVVNAEIGRQHDTDGSSELPQEAQLAILTLARGIHRGNVEFVMTIWPGADTSSAGSAKAL